MPMASVNGVDLYSKTPPAKACRWSGSMSTAATRAAWEPQVRYFSRRYRVMAYNHRGYPPSTVPRAARDYSQDLLVEDLRQLLRHLGLGPVPLGGCSMGANVARDFAIAHGEMTRSLILVGAGAGSVNREQVLKAQEASAAALEREGIATLVGNFENLPTRASFKEKDSRGFAEFLRQASERDRTGVRSSRTSRSSGGAATVWILETELKALRVPGRHRVGDRDAPCVEPSLLMRSWIPHAGLVVSPACGHTPNLEEPGLFNLLVSEFLAAVEGGRWAGLSR